MGNHNYKGRDGDGADEERRRGGGSCAVKEEEVLMEMVGLLVS
jgi:hypothetical protein